jgi:rare lipoprotein A
MPANARCRLASRRRARRWAGNHRRTVVASWCGPGFYGNRTACGQTFTSQLLGVAHRTLPCGTRVTIRYNGRAITVPVVDRGPYVRGRDSDLTEATRNHLGFDGVDTIWATA